MGLTLGHFLREISQIIQCGYAIPKDALVVISQYVIHRHPAWWSEPEQFQPERFTPAQATTRHRCAYIPFGEGPRRCLGEPFALMEMHLVLAIIAQAYTLQVVPEQPGRPGSGRHATPP